MAQPNQQVERECAGCGKMRGLYQFSASQRRKGDDAICIKCIPEIQNVKPGHLKHDVDNSDAKYMANGNSTHGSFGIKTGGVRLPASYTSARTATSTVAGTSTGTVTSTHSYNASSAAPSSHLSSTTNGNERPAHFELRNTGWISEWRQEHVPQLEDDNVETFKDDSDNEDFDM
ncbi:unnamed protein product [Aureobasidium uvarum]|uniref:Stc1 domain-containing protein n=1 Tax=Aureobasidium uvarum TaxID=2773716 RepID=A0A9N8KKP4_9PEZI|nr:unnamed protein product [Aureobasidium uvarum]